MTALLLGIVGILIFAVGFFAGALCMAAAMSEVERERHDY